MKHASRGRLPPRYRREPDMEPLMWVISIAALVTSVAALVVAIRGARRGR